MTPFTIFALLITLAALSSYLNRRFIGLPSTAALMLLSLVLSLGFIGAAWYGVPWRDDLRHLLDQVDFGQALLGGLLSFLLFAGALHIDLNQLREQRWRIFSLAFISTLLSIGVVSLLAYVIFHALGIDLPLLYCLLFGALISPTDPVAVLALLKQADAPPSLNVKFAGESLLNDGAGLVAFLFFLESLQATGPVLDLSWQRGLQLLLHEGLGGLVLGYALGWVAYYLIKTVDDYHVEILLTLALVSGGYALALAVHASGPLAIATAGIVIGTRARHQAMNAETRENLDTFWELIDEILNALLFALVGLQVVALKFHGTYFVAALAMIPAVLLARFLSVGAPGVVFRLLGREVERGGLVLLTWGGLRGAISVALALTVPGGEERDLLLVVTYVVVAFSILVQGTTMPLLLRRVLVRDEEAGVATR